MSTTTSGVQDGGVQDGGPRKAGVATGGPGSGRTGPSMSRLTLIELRKSVDTRAGLWLMVGIAVLTAAVVGLQLAFSDAETRTLASLLVNSQLPVGILLPVLGVLSVTSEWSQRTALATFTLVPSRSRVIAAKALSALVLAVAATVVALVAGVIGFAVGLPLDRSVGGWDLSAVLVPQVFLFQLLNMTIGFAFGLLLLASAPAIVAYFALPILWSILGTVVPGLETAAEWLDLNRTLPPLTEAGVTGREWLQVLTSVALWGALPGLLGLLRVRRTDIS